MMLCVGGMLCEERGRRGLEKEILLVCAYDTDVGRGKERKKGTHMWSYMGIGNIVCVGVELLLVLQRDVIWRSIQAPSLFITLTL